jgi:hypothetical protein
MAHWLYARSWTTGRTLFTPLHNPKWFVFALIWQRNGSRFSNVHMDACSTRWSTLKERVDSTFETDKSLVKKCDYIDIETWMSLIFSACRPDVEDGMLTCASLLS